jgi:hypothetical protein
MKVISTLLVVAAIGLLIPASTFGQETVGKNGHEVDGNGAAGNWANKLVPDGPGTTFLSLNDTRAHQQWLIDTYVTECHARVMDPAWCLAHGYSTDRY